MSSNDRVTTCVGRCTECVGRCSALGVPPKSSLPDIGRAHCMQKLGARRTLDGPNKPSIPRNDLFCRPERCRTYTRSTCRCRAPYIYNYMAEEDLSGLSAKELYKLKLKQIKAREAEQVKQEALEEEERAKRKAEEEAALLVEKLKDKNLRRSANKHISNVVAESTGAVKVNSDTTSKESKLKHISASNAVAETTGAVKVNSDTASKSTTSKESKGLFTYLSNGIGKYGEIKEGVPLVVLTDNERSLLASKDRDLVNAILARAERERAQGQLRHYTSPPRMEPTMPSSPREGLSTGSSLDTLKHALYYRGMDSLRPPTRLHSPNHSPRSARSSPPRDTSAMGTSPSAIPGSRTPYLEELLSKSPPPDRSRRRRSSSPLRPKSHSRRGGKKAQHKGSTQ